MQRFCALREEFPRGPARKFTAESPAFPAFRTQLRRNKAFGGLCGIRLRGGCRIPLGDYKRRLIAAPPKTPVRIALGGGFLYFACTAAFNGLRTMRNFSKAL